MTQSEIVNVNVNGPETASRRRSAPAGPSISRAREEYTPVSRIRKSKPEKRTSLHVVETGGELASGWLLTEKPPAAGDMWRQVAPASGAAGNPVAWLFMTSAGLFRAVAITGLWVVGLAVATRLRAGVGLIVVVIATAAGLIVHHLNP